MLPRSPQAEGRQQARRYQGFDSASQVGARSTTWRPEIDNVAEYEFRAWWTSIQPGWRDSSRAVDGDCEDLRRPGLNGLVSVMAALFYWGSSLGKKAKDRGNRTIVLEDCITAVTQLIRV
ncbi:hypothetical protein BDZ97DRAFT_1658026 [Flammula alnicola]|nr:hypothetical protein BDZ97DRAFT_1658026 [Flammula alnicola]